MNKLIHVLSREVFCTVCMSSSVVMVDNATAGGNSNCVYIATYHLLVCNFVFYIGLMRRK